MRVGRGALGSVGLVVAGVLLGVIGVAVVSLGTGAFSLETQTFERIRCNSSEVEKGGTVWHCTGESPAQREANDEADRRAEYEALRAHREGVSPYEPRERTELKFVRHEGSEGDDPLTVTASRSPVGGWWIAHSADVVGAGVLLTVLGGAATAWGGYRLRAARSA